MVHWRAEQDAEGIQLSRKATAIAELGEGTPAVGETWVCAASEDSKRRLDGNALPSSPVTTSVNCLAIDCYFYTIALTHRCNRWQKSPDCRQRSKELPGGTRVARIRLRSVRGVMISPAAEDSVLGVQWHGKKGGDL